MPASTPQPAPAWSAAPQAATVKLVIGIERKLTLPPPPVIPTSDPVVAQPSRLVLPSPASLGITIESPRETASQR